MFTMENQNQKTMLSEHFSFEEMVRSGVAERRAIDNIPTGADIERMRLLCANVLEPVRRRFGVTRISSGFRSAELNAAVGVCRHRSICLAKLPIYIYRVWRRE